MKTSRYGRRIVVIAECPNDGDAMAQKLFESGVKPAVYAPQAIVLARHVLSENLREINSQMLKHGTPWLLVKTSGTAGWVGPLFVPGRTGCWECLVHRLCENDYQDVPRTPVRLATLKRAAAEVLRWLDAGGSCPLEGRIQTVVNSSDSSKLHVLIRRPECPKCGRRQTRGRHGIRLQSRTKLPRTQHTCTVQETLKRLIPFESDLTGIVTLLPTEACWARFHICLGLHCRALPQDANQHGLRLPAQPAVGKGGTPEEARVSCLAEAVERYSIQWHGDEIRLKAREKDLHGAAFGLRGLALWSERQLRERTRWNREVGGFSWIPESQVPNDTEIDWTTVWSLTSDSQRYVPTAYCYLHHHASPYLADSNGCASGNVLEEAILNGFLELVERDAVGIWWYNRLSRTGVLLDDPTYKTTEREFRARGRTLTLLDLTSDFGISVIAAISARKNGTRILIGTAAHLNPEVAVSRAIQELCQVIETLDTSDAKRPPRRLATVEAALHRWLLGENIRDHDYLVPLGKSKRFQELPDRSRPNLKDEIEWCVARAGGLGLEVLVLDMTRRDLNFPVVRVIVPGMRHCWARLAPGRLYDVPVKLGWRKRALRETELNPVAYFL